MSKQFMIKDKYIHKLILVKKYGESNLNIVFIIPELQVKEFDYRIYVHTSENLINVNIARKYLKYYKTIFTYNCLDQDFEMLSHDSREYERILEKVSMHNVC